MKVMVGCPIRNRDWIVEKYLECILRLNFPPEDLSICFVLNDSIDDTDYYLNKFRKEHGKRYSNFTILRRNYNQTKDVRTSSTRQMIYVTLSKLRNMLVEKAVLEDVDYLFSVDSDILFEPDALNKLIECQKDIVSAQIWNFKNILPNVMRKNEYGRAKTLLNFPKDSVFECDVTGAIYLISKSVMRRGVRYAYHMQGEDIAFCESAQSKGFKIYCNPLVECRHVMRKEDL